jgi:hypothetical protein
MNALVSGTLMSNAVNQIKRELENLQRGIDMIQDLLIYADDNLQWRERLIKHHWLADSEQVKASIMNEVSAIEGELRQGEKLAAPKKGDK